MKQNISGLIISMLFLGTISYAAESPQTTQTKQKETTAENNNESRKKTDAEKAKLRITLKYLSQLITKKSPETPDKQTQLQKLELEKLLLVLHQKQNAQLTQDVKKQLNVGTKAQTFEEAIAEKDREIFTWYLENYASLFTTPLSIAYKQYPKITTAIGTFATALAASGFYTAWQNRDKITSQGKALSSALLAKTLQIGEKTKNEITEVSTTLAQRGQAFIQNIGKKIGDIWSGFWNKQIDSSTPTTPRSDITPELIREESITPIERTKQFEEEYIKLQTQVEKEQSDITTKEPNVTNSAQPEITTKVDTVTE